jgi:hypothetical protein
MRRIERINVAPDQPVIVEEPRHGSGAALSPYQWAPKLGQGLRSFCSYLLLFLGPDLRIVFRPVSRARRAAPATERTIVDFDVRNNPPASVATRVDVLSLIVSPCHDYIGQECQNRSPILEIPAVQGSVVARAFFAAGAGHGGKFGYNFNKFF